MRVVTSLKLYVWRRRMWLSPLKVSCYIHYKDHDRRKASLTSPRNRSHPVNWISHLYRESRPAQRVICSGQVWCPFLCWGAPDRGSASWEISLLKGRGPNLEGVHNIVGCALSSCSAGEWMDDCTSQAVQTEGGPSDWGTHSSLAIWLLQKGGQA